MFGPFLLVLFLVYFWVRLDNEGEARWMAPAALVGELIVFLLIALDSFISAPSVGQLPNALIRSQTDDRSISQQRSGTNEKGMASALVVGVVVGAGVGAAIFAVTGEAFWIAIGPGFGVGIGGALGSRVDD